MTDAPANADQPADLLQRFNAWEKEDDDHWGDWRKSARESYAFVCSDQWTKTERAEAEEAGRLVTTINRIGPMIDAVAGAEIIDRQQVQYVPRTTEDAGVNELLTMGAEWIRDQTLADQEESDAFRDALICGLGFTETVMSYDDEPEGKVIIQRIDPLEVIPDAAARKSNLIDSRRLRRKRRIDKAEFEQTYPGVPVETDREVHPAVRSAGSARTAYSNTGFEDKDQLADDEVEVCEWQWFEYEVVFLTVNPLTQQLVELSPEEHKEGQDAGFVTDSSRQRRKIYWRALKCGNQILEYERLPDNEFTIKAITGKRDRNKGVFQGIVEPMKDPQRFANLFFSMLHHIIRTNAKGGIMAEQDAFVDAGKAQESWAASDAITWVKANKLNSIRDKPAPNIPPQITQLLQLSIAGIKDASGINEELLGLVGREQAGVLEHQRKQAAYAILAGFYDSLRFYRKVQGTLLLKYIQKYLPEGYLVRIIGNDGNPRYVPLAKQPDTLKFDVIVDEAPAGPNQKEKIWALISNMQGILKDAGPQVWSELVEYSPFPDKINKSLKQVFIQQAQPKQPDPAMVARQQADIGKDQAGATKDMADAQHTQAETAMLGAQASLYQAQAAQIIPTPFGA